MSYRVFSDPRYDFSANGDIDQDGILNHEDVCIANPYTPDYHDFCFKRAGLMFYDHFEKTKQHIKDNLNNWPLSMFNPIDELMQDVDFVVEVSSFIASVLIGGASFPSDAESAKIKTCDDLKNYWSAAESLASSAEGGARMAFIIFLVIPEIRTKVIAGLAHFVLNNLANEYDDVADSADSAYRGLCIDTPRDQ